MTIQESTFGVIREGEETFVSVESNPTLKKIPVRVYSKEMMDSLLETQQAMINALKEEEKNKEEEKDEKKENSIFKAIKDFFH